MSAATDNTRKPHVLVTEAFEPAARARLEARCTVDWADEIWPDEDAIVARIPGADGLIVRNKTQVTARVLEAAGRNLKVLGRLGVGLDNLDMAACAERGVTVCPATGANAVSVAEYVTTTAMLLLRPAYSANAAVLAGEWPRNELGQGRELRARRFGIVGLGDIGRVVAARAQSFGAEVVAYDPAVDPATMQALGVTSVSIDQLTATSDVITLHVPLIDATRGLFDGARLAAMKSDAVIINTARGGIIDEAALADTLRGGHLGGAALDVFTTEPLNADLQALLAGVPRLILTPHIAGVSADANTAVSDMTVDNVLRVLFG